MKRIKIVLALATLAALVASPLMAAGIPGTINLQGRFTDAAHGIVEPTAAASGGEIISYQSADSPLQRVLPETG